MHRTSRAVAALAVVLVAGCDDPAPPVAAAAAVDFTVWQAGSSRPVADQLYPQHGTAALDVLHYGLELDWQPARKVLTGTATLRIRPTADAAEMRLDFKPYTLGQVTVDGAAARATVVKEKLVVSASVRKDKPLTLVVAYHGKPSTTPIPSHRSDVEPLGLTVTEEGGLWTMQEPWGAFTWYPANDQPSDKALYDIAVTVPPGWSGIAAGSPVTQQGNTFRYRSTDPMASYLQTLAVGRYRKVSAQGPRGLPLTYWYRPGRDEKFLPSLKKSPAFIAFLEKRFGPYPFPTGGAVMVDSESAMETQQMVTMGGKKKRFDQRGFEEDLLHEYAHHWFGDSVTPSTWTDLWLNEGWATYAQFLYSQTVLRFSDQQLEDHLRRSDADLRERLGPPGKPRAANFAESNVYICPAAMLKELHDALGDEKFFALGRAWVQEHRNSQQTRASFTAFVNQETGRDFTELINSWLDAKKTPGD